MLTMDIAACHILTWALFLLAIVLSPSLQSLRPSLVNTSLCMKVANQRDKQCTMAKKQCTRISTTYTQTSPTHQQPKETHHHLCRMIQNLLGHKSSKLEDGLQRITHKISQGTMATLTPSNSS